MINVILKLVDICFIIDYLPTLKYGSRQVILIVNFVKIQFYY